jgi:predicted AlkP superfamily phosphohydrolase/phosphomutase/tetratricopeptide (TPR) repeat protein
MNARKKVLLIGWDAADWKVINPLMDAGKMPNVQRLVDQGSMANIATLHPPLSPMLWTSIATGKRPFKHGIHGFIEPTVDGMGVHPVTNLSRTCKAVWNILNQNDVKSIVIGWWPSHPAEPIDGVMLSDHYHRSRGSLEKGWPMLPGTIHPPELIETLAELRLHKEEIVGEMVDPFVPRAREVDQNKDHRLSGLASTLAECLSIHSAATWLIENQPWDLFAVYYDAIDHFCHGFMRYHPPKQDQIKQEDFDLYHNVVTAAYRLHDQMLGVLLGKVGDDVTVILMSDHGFHPDHLRPRAIPSIPAGPAIEHRDFGILAIKGPGIKRDELLHGASVLDITPTLLSLFGLPVGEDMDGKVLMRAFEDPPDVATIPSWDEVAGNDGRHPPHTRLDPVAAREALEQLVALGYIARPDQDNEKAVADTVDELRYNLGEAYQDADRHAEALEIFRELHRHDPDEQRYAVHRFVSCQAIGLVDEMRSIVEDLDGRRRELFTQARAKIEEFVALIKERVAERKAKAGAPDPEAAASEPDQETVEAIAAELAPSEPEPEVIAGHGDGEPVATEPKKPEPLLTAGERKEFVKWRNLSRFQPPVIDYLMAQVLAMEGSHARALETLGRVQEADLARPGLLLQTAELYIKLQRWEEAEAVFAKALEVDPDNPHAHLGMCRMYLRRRDHAAAVRSALEALERLYHYPLAHFFLGVALRGMKEYRRAVGAFRTALSLNPNFPHAHLHLAAILGRRFKDRAGAAEHLRLYHQLREAAKAPGKAELDREPAPFAATAEEPAPFAATTPAAPVNPPEIGEGVVVVSGLPRSGTSMIMQMLAAGGQPILTDGLREADTDNPLGYFEFEPVKQLHRDAKCLEEAEGKAVKIVAPLLPHLPAGSPCHVIFIERQLDEVLASQGQMLIRRGESVSDSPGRRDRLKDEYGRSVRKIKEFLTRRPRTRVLFLNHADVILDPEAAAAAINTFLGGRLTTAAMIDEVNPSLHRNRAEDAKRAARLQGVQQIA